MSQPWYRDGLCFECTGCGDCCTGAPGYVWVNREERIALAAAVGLTLDEFEDRYTRSVGKRRSLIEFDGGDCVFFDPEKRVCGVYEARPRQCRTWPFWSSNLRDPKTWRQTADACPGANRGRRFTLEEIEELRNVLRI